MRANQHCYPNCDQAKISTGQLYRVKVPSNVKIEEVLPPCGAWIIKAAIALAFWSTIYDYHGFKMNYKPDVDQNGIN